MSKTTPTGFIALRSLKRGQTTAAEALAEIRRIYFKTSKRTIEHDIAHAIELLRSMEHEDDRDKAAVYMDGLSQMRSEWATASRRDSGRSGHAAKPPSRTTPARTTKAAKRR
mgnify:CR=1 FL=1